MRKIILILLAIGVIGAGIGYYMVNKPVPSLEKKKADLEVTAAKLLTDYQLNETAANETYLGKLVLVSGKVVDITQENGIKKIHLETPNPMSLIICELETGMEIGELKPGEEAKIKGSCTGYQSIGDMGDVILVQSTLVKK